MLRKRERNTITFTLVATVAATKWNENPLKLYGGKYKMALAGGAAGLCCCSEKGENKNIRYVNWDL